MDINRTSSGPAIPLTPLFHHHHHQQQISDNITIIDQPPTRLPKPPPPPLPPRPCLPRLDLFEGSRKKYMEVGLPLYEAANKGNWKAAKAILDREPDLTRFAITDNYETALHVAAAAKSTKSVEEFVEKLVNLMDEKDLELQNKNYNTALILAAAAGNVKTATIMVRKNPALLEIPGSRSLMPLYIAALFTKSDMVRYIYNSSKMSGQCWTHENRGAVLTRCVQAEFFDVAMRIVRDHPELTAKKMLMTDVLLHLAQNVKSFKGIKPHMGIIDSIFHGKAGPTKRDSEALRFLRIIWQRIAIMPKSEIHDILNGPPLEVKTQGAITKTYPSRVLFIAAKMGNARFIRELIQSYPDLIWKLDDKGRTIIHIGVKHRHVRIYRLLHEFSIIRDIITPMRDKDGNTMLHLLAKSAKSKRLQNVSGFALQMQRELLWFKELEQMIPLHYREGENNKGETAQDLFPSMHQDLLEKGEKWMKHTASECMVVAALIATIVFAAAFTLPGGYHQDLGIPIFRHKPSLIVFVISDAVSLIFSSISILMFLSILTSRYAQEDFLGSLPGKLFLGLATLFLSIVTMMIAFSASFFVLYNKKLKWVPITITGLAGLPVIIYAILQYRLLGDVFSSTYQNKNLFKPKNRIHKRLFNLLSES